MKKKSVSLLMATTMVAGLLSGCGGNANTPATNENNANTDNPAANDNNVSADDSASADNPADASGDNAAGQDCRK